MMKSLSVLIESIIVGLYVSPYMVLSENREPKNFTVYQFIMFIAMIPEWSH